MAVAWLSMLKVQVQVPEAQTRFSCGLADLELRCWCREGSGGENRGEDGGGELHLDD